MIVLQWKVDACGYKAGDKFILPSPSGGPAKIDSLPEGGDIDYKEWWKFHFNQPSYLDKNK